MKRLNKKTDLKKLAIDTTTIRILSSSEEKLVVAGAGTGTVRDTVTCSREPDTCA